MMGKLRSARLVVKVDPKRALPPLPALDAPVKLSVVTVASGVEYHPRLALTYEAVRVAQQGLPKGSEVELVLSWAGLREEAPSGPKGPDKVVTWVPAPGPFCVSRGRNVGAKAASHDLILFLDADVLLHPEALVRMVDACALGNTLAMVMKLRDGDEDETRPAHGDCGTILVPRAAFFEIRGYDEFYRGWGAEDNDVVDRLVLAGLKLVNLTARDGLMNTHQWHPESTRNRSRVHENRTYYWVSTSVKRNLLRWGERELPK